MDINYRKNTMESEVNRTRNIKRIDESKVDEKFRENTESDSSVPFPSHQREENKNGRIKNLEQNEEQMEI